MAQATARTSGFRKALRRNRQLYWLLLPAAIYVLVFRYLLMAGNYIAFTQYDIFSKDGPLLGMFTGRFVGLTHFQKLFSDPKVWGLIKNTLIISVLKIVWLQPLPIALAIMINEVRASWYKRSVQTIFYLPHFLSWVIAGGLVLQFVGAYGPLNNAMMQMGVIDSPVVFIQRPEYFRSILVASAGWKEIGWNTIVYLAALTAIDPQLYEAGRMDGAGKLQQILYITLPELMPTILMLFTIRMGYLLDAGFDQVFNLYSPFVYSTGDIVGTYVYRNMSDVQNLSYNGAISLFESLVGLVLLFVANKITRRFFGRGIW